MASIFKKGAKWWCRLKGLHKPGKWASAPTPFKAKPDTQAAALRFAVAAQKRLDARLTPDGPLTVARYAAAWLKERADRNIASVADDRGRINNHVLPVLGQMLLADVRPRHIRDLVRALNKNPDLAPRTVLNIYGALTTMFRDAETEELIGSNPCKTKAGELPDKNDKDPNWRDLATYSTPEVMSLLTDPRIPPERRVQYAFKALGGLRHGEVAGLQWSNMMTETPLRKLVVARSYTNERTKTGVARGVPLHPALEIVVAKWRDHWPRIYGRVPAADDLVVPTRKMTCIDANDAGRYFKADLEELGLRIEAGDFRHRGGHDLRAWFISTALASGADPIALMRVTHTKAKDVQSGYTRLPWEVLCRAVAKLPIVLDGDPLRLAPDYATRELSAVRRWRKMATPTGFEAVSGTARGAAVALNSQNDGELVTSCDLSIAALVRSVVTGSEEE